MRKKLLIACLFLLSLSAYAQTYSNGVWYSFLDNSEHAMNTQGDYDTGGIFAPTAGTLNVQWRYEWIDLFGAFKKIDTDVLESADGGNTSREVGSLAENTDKNSNTTEHFSISKDINWIKFNREGVPTHKVVVYHIDIPLAKHILLPSGEYGTTTGAHDFGTVNALSASEPFHVSLRSFLTAGDITVSSSEPEVFRIGNAENTESIVYAVGANACASANGKEKKAAEGLLGNIANYGFDIYFCPQEGKDYAGTVTITDGTSTVEISLTGVGKKIKQTIAWETMTPILTSDIIAPATASSGLPVSYSFEPEGIVSFADGAFTILSEGQVVITASQEGNNTYNAAEPVVRDITIYPAETYSGYAAEICGGEEYTDAHFSGLTETGRYWDTIPNSFGGDSIITFELTVHPVYATDEELSMYVGAQETWQEKDLSTLPVCDTTLIVRYATVHGCDSVYSLHLTVMERPTTYGVDTLNICEGDVAEYEGKSYDKAITESVLLSRKNLLGGDSIVALTVNVWPVTHETAEMTIDKGEEVVWQDIPLATMPVGDTTLVAQYTSAHGCDSVYTLHLTVIQRPTTYGVDTILLCTGEKALYDGKTYRHSMQDSVLLSQKNQFGGDSIVWLVVEVFPTMHMTETRTITEGDSVNWQGYDLSTMPVGDTTLVAQYTSVHGCDSTYTLHLEVQLRMPEALDEVDDAANTPSKFFRNGQMYIRKNGQVYNLQGTKIEEE